MPNKFFFDAYPRHRFGRRHPQSGRRRGRASLNESQVESSCSHRRRANPLHITSAKHYKYKARVATCTKRFRIQRAENRIMKTSLASNAQAPGPSGCRSPWPTANESGKPIPTEAPLRHRGKTHTTERNAQNKKIYPWYGRERVPLAEQLKTRTTDGLEEPDGRPGWTLGRPCSSARRPQPLRRQRGDWRSLGQLRSFWRLASS